MRYVTIEDFLRAAAAFLEKRSPVFLLVTGLVLVALLGGLDYFTGDFSFLVFDFIPVFLVTWFAGPGPGIFISFAGAFSWFMVEVLSTPYHKHPFVHYWNMGVKLIFFLGMVYVFYELKKALTRQNQLARIDYLTGAMNSRAFLETAANELELCRRYGRFFTLAYLDIDNFKEVNDRFGHNTGNRLLAEVVRGMRHNTRRIDVVARLGGDEFALLMPETTSEAARSVISRIVQLLADVFGENGWQVTFSIGVVTYLNPPSSIDEMINRADALMYSVKTSGKNMVRYEIYKETPAVGLQEGVK